MTDTVAALGQQRHAVLSERLAAALVAVLLLAAGLIVTPIASRPGPEIPGFMPAFAGAMIVIDLVLAVLLFSKGAIDRSDAPIRLGTAYLFAGLIILPHIAAFPGAFLQDELIGGPGSAVWLWSFWHTGFAIAIMRHAVSRTTDARPCGIRWSAVATTAAVIVFTTIATWGLPYLPVVLKDRTYQTGSFALALQLVVVSTNVMALLVVMARRRMRSAEDLWLAVAMLAASVDVWLTFRAGSRFSLGWYIGRGASLVTSAVVLVSLFRDITDLYGQVAQANQVLERLAYVDGLTGLSNRRHLDATIATEWRRAQRDGRPLSIVMLDVDHFKLFNDSYGHQEGDACLRAIGGCLSGHGRRPGDMAARYGGEEFALVLPATDLAGAIFLGNQLRLAVRGLAIPHDKSPYGIATVSVGVATAEPSADEDATAALARADLALYEAKRAGRDQVCPQPAKPLLEAQDRRNLVRPDAAKAA